MTDMQEDKNIIIKIKEFLQNNPKISIPFLQKKFKLTYDKAKKLCILFGFEK